MADELTEQQVYMLNYLREQVNGLMKANWDFMNYKINKQVKSEDNSIM